MSAPADAPPSGRPPLVVVAGSTATGKTEVALWLARALDGELVGADSVQVYRGLDVGSAKPTPAELGGTPHHLLSVLDPDQEVDAMQFASLADDAIRGVVARGRLPIVVGGTGLWIRALVRGLVELPPVDPALRARLDEETRRLGAPAMHARLSDIDPTSARTVHPNDALRIVRALEVHAQTGQALGDLRAEHALGAPRYPTLFVVLDRPREDLYRRIEARADAMLAGGWLPEVRDMVARFGRHVRPLGAVGYREVVEHLEDGVPLEETRRRIVKATKVYARRQRTWFGSEPGVDWRAAPADVMTPQGRVRVARSVGRA